MIISHTDASHLAQRARQRHDDAALPDAIVLLDACSTHALRQLSNLAEAHKQCPARACRRAHHCAGRPLGCGDLIRRAELALDAAELIDELYWRVLERLVAEDAGEAGR